MLRGSKRGVLWLSLAIAFIFAIPQISHGQSGGGGTVIQVVEAEPPSIGPIHTGTTSNEISAKVFETLLFDRDGKTEPRLATSWSVSSDNKAYTFKIRQGVKWHDGQPFTAQDVVFTALSHWKKLSIYPFENIEGAESPDPETVVIRFKLPFAPSIIYTLLGAQWSYVIPRHVYDGSPIMQNPKNRAPIGTGPFKFKEWKTGQHIILERNPDYYLAGFPKLDRLIFRMERNDANRLALLESGEVQMGMRNIVPLRDMERLKKNKDLVVSTKGSENADWSLLLLLNVRKPDTAKLQVRQAIAHALDMQQIVDVVYAGYASVARGPIRASRPLFNPKIASYEFNRAQAEKLLDQAGYPKGADGVRMTLKFVVPTWFVTTRQAGDVVKQQLEAVGIRVNMETPDGATSQRLIYREYDFDIALTNTSTIADPAIGLLPIWWTKGIRPGLPFRNASGYSSPEMDEVIEAQWLATDPAKRKELLGRFQFLAQRDLPVISIADMEMVNVLNKRVGNALNMGRWYYTDWADLTISK